MGKCKKKLYPFFQEMALTQKRLKVGGGQNLLEQVSDNRARGHDFFTRPVETGSLLFLTRLIRGHALSYPSDQSGVTTFFFN